MKEIIFAMIVIFVGLLYVGGLDFIDEMQDNYHYCEMVSLWYEDAHLEQGMRRGWPPYRNDIYCN